MSGVEAMYRQLAYDNFEPQLIRDLEDDENVLEVCQQEIERLGFPLPDDEDVWLEFVYAAQEMVEIQQNGFVYRKERDDSKPGGWDHVLYTTANHPGFKSYQ